MFFFEIHEEEVHFCGRASEGGEGVKRKEKEEEKTRERGREVKYLSEPLTKIFLGSNQMVGYSLFYTLHLLFLLYCCYSTKG